MLIHRIPSTFTRSAFLAALTFCSFPAFASGAGDNHHLATASAVFGRGLNTAQPGNPVNHVIMPNEIKIKVGGVVDFRLAGYHDIIIFKPGVVLEDLIDAGGGEFPTFQTFFVIPPDPNAPLQPEIAFLTDEIYYRGLNPAGGPIGTPATANPNNTLNRNEPIAFLETGTYLVICNVRPHLLDGMYAYVKVIK